MIRAFIRFAIDRPVLNHILLAFMLVLAVFAYRDIPKEIFPPSTLDEISVTGGYPGASADVLDKMVVKQLEDGLKGLSEIDTLDTVIQNGRFSITADIKPGNDRQLVLSDVKDVIANIRRDLPSDMDEPIAKVVIHDYPLLLVAVSGDVPKKRLLEAADDLKSRLALIKDLSGLAIRGDADEEVRIIFDRKKLDAYGISKERFYQAVSGLASIYPAGTIKATGEHLYISGA
jgi:multidrug efflux pump subunit AcrB